MTAAEIDGLELSYNGAAALRLTKACIRNGQVTIILGPNGSGKTTLLRCLAGEISGTNGGVTISGLPLSRLSPLELARAVAYVPHEEQTPFPITAREVVAMGRLCRSRGLFESEEDWHIVDRAMEDADCLRFSSRLMDSLSAGERHRVLIARGLAQEPRLLLLDEPTSHLDLAHQAALRELLLRIKGESVAIVVATHDLAWSFSVADEIWVLRAGELLQQGSPDDLASGKSLSHAYGVPVEMIRRDAQWIAAIG